MTPEQRQEIIRLLEKGEELSPEWARILFPPEKREYELVYHGKEREEDILANTLAVPLQRIRTFGNNGDRQNMLIFGDNLQVMKSLLEMKKAGKLCNTDGTPGVRLIYIDPPFATKQEFRGNQDQKAYQDKIAGAKFLEFLRKRLVFLRELLSEDGSIYVHLDWKKVHYVKVLLDEVFGETKFRNDLIWKYFGPTSTEKNFPRKHDILLFYTKSDNYNFNEEATLIEYDDKAVRRYDKMDKEGKRYKFYYDNDGTVRKAYMKEGKPTEIFEIPFVQGTAEERIGYPTQKPEALLDRIIKASSNPGD
ncbi:MAG: site-specific DNA-methyltransferase, partial [Nitrospinae bacterium]|nr:site-specific DNA-methyltransferase [Nitrospinota bacterium]